MGRGKKSINNVSLIREYYTRIDRSDIDWVVALFENSATYERADAVYTGLAEIARFFREERLIRGSHNIDDIISNCDGDSVIAIGRFIGVGAAGDCRDVRFADVWQFGPTGFVRRRRTFLARGNEYVRQ